MQTARSPLLMNRDDSALLIVDVQEKLVPHIAEQQAMLWNIGRLCRGAAVLGVPVCLTEQYPRGLGATVQEIKDQLGPDMAIHEKLMFSARECTELNSALQDKNIRNVVLTGIETHICVLQTAMDLMANGYNVFICIDGVGSRHEEDFMTAMQRMETSGATLVSTEMVLFEWCEKAGTPEFKKISRIAQEEFDGGDEAED